MKTLAQAIGAIAGVIIAIVLVFAALIALFEYVWNWLMPGTFGLVRADFWHAAGFLILMYLIFGGIKYRQDNKPK